MEMREDYLPQPPKESRYRKARGDKKCANCVHFLDAACHLWDAYAEANYVCDDYKENVTGMGTV